MPPIKPSIIDEPLATYEEKKKALKKIKWICFKSMVLPPLIANVVLWLPIIIYNIIYPPSEYATGGGSNGESFFGEFIFWIFVIVPFYLIVALVRYIKFVADLPLIPKDK